MEEDLVEVKIIGKITSDVEVRISASGKHWLYFTVESICNGYKRFNTFMAFNEIADNLSKNAIKGNRIKILANVGRSKDKKTNKFETNITVYDFEMLKDDNKSKSNKKEILSPNPEIADIPQNDLSDLPF